MTTRVSRKSAYEASDILDLWLPVHYRLHSLAAPRAHFFPCCHRREVDSIMVGHPPCTDLAVSGSRHFVEKHDKQERALAFFEFLWNAPIHRICLENPIGIISTQIGKPTQIIQPWQFGHGETKGTCLWLKNLPPLTPTNLVPGREARIHKMPPSKDRWKKRSYTLQGIADAMASQWPWF